MLVRHRMIMVAEAALDLIVDLAFSSYQSLARLKRLRLGEAVEAHLLMEMVLTVQTQHLAAT